MEACKHEEVIRTLDEWEIWKAWTEAAGKVALLQCGSPQCKNCPAFTEKIQALKQSFQFKHVYVNTHDAEEDLLEALQVTRLPAFFLTRTAGTETHQGQASTPEDIERAVRALCTPVLSLDDDF